MRVLIADDDARTVARVSRICTDLGCSVVTASSPTEVTDASCDQFDAAILDNRLITGSEQEHGVKALIRLRRARRQVVLMTEYPDEHLRAMTVQEDAFYLEKTPDLARFDADLAALVGQMRDRVRSRIRVPYGEWAERTGADYATRAKYLIGGVIEHGVPDTVKRIKDIGKSPTKTTARAKVLPLHLNHLVAYIAAVPSLRNAPNEYATHLACSIPQLVCEALDAAPFDIRLKLRGTFTKIHLYHALSALPDSVLILAEVGRAARIASFLDAAAAAVDTKHAGFSKGVRMTGSTFATLGTKMAAARVSAADLESGVGRRRRLYALVGFDTTIDELGGESAEGRRVHRADRHLIEQFFQQTGEPPIGTDREGLVAWADVQQHVVPHNIDRAQWLRLVKCAKAVADITGEVSRDTMTYFLGERDVLADDPHTLKVAVDSERRFDDFFLEECAEPSLSTLYFEQYRMGPYQVLPYNSWSADLSATTDPVEVRSKIIPMIPAAQDLEQARSILLATAAPFRRRWVADYLSFLFHSDLWRHDRSVRDTLSAVDPEIRASMEWHGEGLVENTTKWLERITAPESERMPAIPVHFIPYLWTEREWADRSQAISELFRCVGATLQEQL